eukprot:743822-Amphidinium_carterae.2
MADPNQQLRTAKGGRKIWKCRLRRYLTATVAMTQMPVAKICNYAGNTARWDWFESGLNVLHLRTSKASLQMMCF